ncbi:hypothetical protein FOZ61_007474 [Perkinsus olseni]|uniref:Uncharacterized protein n=1 Tax=Perkinsus olseni TaxID=32597 RepID=A0A7J6L951_PEROL|nr:hypothetical protein FOZ61_007474 [Perkinsus olseni]
MSTDQDEYGSLTLFHHKFKALLSMPLWFYLSMVSVMSVVIAAGINVWVAHAIYPPDIAVQAGVWAWPHTICGDLVITAAASFFGTWMMAPTMSLNLILTGFPAEVKPSSFPRVSMKIPRWLKINPVFGKDPENPMSICSEGTAAVRQVIVAGIGAAIMAGTWGIILSLFMMLHPIPWCRGDLMLLKGLYGAVTEAICNSLAMTVLVIQVSPRMNSLAAQERSPPSDRTRLPEP